MAGQNQRQLLAMPSEVETALQWSSMYVSVATILRHDVSIINGLIKTLNRDMKKVQGFTVDEILYLKEYIKIFEPICSGLLAED